MKEELSLLSELIRLARADNVVKKEEYTFLLKLAEMLKVDKSELDKLFEEYADYYPPAVEADRIIQFQRLILLANVDLEVHPNEVDLLRFTGLKLGLNPDAIDVVLERMKGKKSGLIPKDELLEIFNVYNN